MAGLLAGGLGTLPLATIAAVGRGQLPDVFGRVRDRINHELPPAEAAELRLATGLLMSLRHRRPVVESLVRGVRDMKESWLYQEIAAEGRAEGRVEGERTLLVAQATRRFGRPPAAVLDRLNGMTDADELTRLGVALFDATGWDDWLRPR